jgi:hypothetical protein
MRLTGTALRGTILKRTNSSAKAFARDKGAL